MLEELLLSRWALVQEGWMGEPGARTELPILGAAEPHSCAESTNAVNTDDLTASCKLDTLLFFPISHLFTLFALYS